MSSEKRVRLSKPYVVNDREVLSSFQEILNDGYFVQGTYVRNFEELFSSYLSVRHCVAVSSGTAALHLALLALGIGPGDEVIVPAFTFPATGNAVELAGARPVFVDVDPRTFNIRIDEIEKCVTKKTAAILVVHLFGNPVDMDSVLNIAQRHGLRVIEDAAGALGSLYKGRLCGTMGDVGCFSFHPRKIVTTGEGGMVVTNSHEIAERVRVLRNHGMIQVDDTKDFVAPGLNYRMNEFEAALGIVQMKNLSSTITERISLARIFGQKLGSIDNLELQVSNDECLNMHQAFVVRLSKGENLEVIRELAERGVEVTVGTYALHALSFYSKKYGYKPSDYPVAAQLHHESLALPFYNGMTMEEIDTVVQRLKEVLEFENRSNQDE